MTDENQPEDVTIDNMSFEPSILDIRPGASVLWRNRAGTRHTVTAGDFDSGFLEQGMAFCHTFSAPGDFPYACAIHPLMTGMIRVR